MKWILKFNSIPQAKVYLEMNVLTLESAIHQVETRAPKMEVTRLREPMSRVPVFKELQPRVMIDKSENLNKTVQVCPRIETLGNNW